MKEKKSINPFQLLNQPLNTIQASLITGFFILIFILLGSFLYNSNLSEPSTYFYPRRFKASLKTLTLSLQSPLDEQIVDGEEVVVKGQTLPNTTVMVYSDTEANSTESDKNGNFETTITLAEGINTLTVTAFASNGEEKSLNLNLVYDDQVKGAKTVQTATATKKADIGNVDKVEPNSLTIEKKNSNQKIKTTIDKNTKIVGKLKDTGLVAIVASESGSTTNSGQLKKALKIYVKEASASAQSKRQAVQGVISAISGDTITLTHQIQSSRIYTLQVDSQTLIKIKGLENTTLNKLTIGQRIAAVGDLQTNGLLLAIRIHVIPGKATGVFNKYPTRVPTSALTPTLAITTTPTSTPTATVTTTPTNTPTVTLTPTPTIPTL